MVCLNTFIPVVFFVDLAISGYIWPIQRRRDGVVESGGTHAAHARLGALLCCLAWWMPESEMVMTWG